uniref:Uncharacterized protein LOC113799375 n=1 Tax=Dermatophagoides pteronyssinus TaxID=6956 RepID=A0A6P6YLG7_DERPT
MIPYKSVYGFPDKCTKIIEYKESTENELREKYRTCQIKFLEKWQITINHYYTESLNFCCFVYEVLECENKVLSECDLDYSDRNERDTRRLFDKSCQPIIAKNSCGKSNENETNWLKIVGIAIAIAASVASCILGIRCIYNRFKNSPELKIQMEAKNAYKKDKFEELLKLELARTTYDEEVDKRDSQLIEKTTEMIIEGEKSKNSGLVKKLGLLVGIGSNKNEPPKAEKGKGIGLKKQVANLFRKNPEKQKMKKLKEKIWSRINEDSKQEEFWKDFNKYSESYYNKQSDTTTKKNKWFPWRKNKAEEVTKIEKDKIPVSVSVKHNLESKNADAQGIEETLNIQSSVSHEDKIPPTTVSEPVQEKIKPTTAETQSIKGTLSIQPSVSHEDKIPPTTVSEPVPEKIESKTSETQVIKGTTLSIQPNNSHEDKIPPTTVSEPVQEKIQSKTTEAREMKGTVKIPPSVLHQDKMQDESKESISSGKLSPEFLQNEEDVINVQKDQNLNGLLEPSKVLSDLDDEQLINLTQLPPEPLRRKEIILHKSVNGIPIFSEMAKESYKNGFKYPYFGLIAEEAALTKQWDIIQAEYRKKLEELKPLRTKKKLFGMRNKKMLTDAEKQKEIDQQCNDIEKELIKAEKEFKSQEKDLKNQIEKAKK